MEHSLLYNSCIPVWASVPTQTIARDFSPLLLIFRQNVIFAKFSTYFLPNLSHIFAKFSTYFWQYFVLHIFCGKFSCQKNSTKFHILFAMFLHTNFFRFYFYFYFITIMITSKRKNKTVDIIDFVTTTMIMITSKPKNKTVGIIDFVTTTTIFAPQDKNTCTVLLLSY